MKKIISLLLGWLLLTSILASCQKTPDDTISSDSQETVSETHSGDRETMERQLPYNPIIYDQAGKWMKHEFLKAHIVRGICYPEYEGVNTLDESYPDEYSMIISTQEQFKEAFAEFPEEIDFEKEMLILYIFKDIKNGYDCKIKDIELDGQTLKVHFLHNEADPTLGPVGDCSAPLQRCLVVKMDKLTVETLEVEMSFEYFN